jgi:hypothetical protein
MKPDWDKLMDAFSTSTTQLIADVDCTTEGKALCDRNGIKGYPSLKWGDPSALEDYKGGRDYATLHKFVLTNLKPVCSPANADLCDDVKKAEIEKFSAMSAEELNKSIAEKEAEAEAAEKTFKDLVAELQEAYQKLMSDKEAALEAVKESGLGLMKAVKAHKQAPAKKTDEL